jgi:hypothetical protein
MATGKKHALNIKVNATQWAVYKLANLKAFPGYV